MSITSPPAGALQTGWRLASPEAAPEPILGLRLLRYEAEGRPGALPAITGLRLQAVGVPEATMVEDLRAGLTCLVDLPPGPRRILVTDPARRFLPAALTVVVPPRFPPRPTLGGAGNTAPRPAPPPRLTLRLRPSPSRAIPAGMTAVIGTLRDAAGRTVALGRLDCGSVMEGRPVRIVTWTDAEGRFALLLPGEAPRLDQPPPPPRPRPLEVALPVPGLAAALAADFLAALPDDLDGMEPVRQEGLFHPAAFRPLDADGQPAETPAGTLPIRPGRTIRWDLLAG